MVQLIGRPSLFIPYTSIDFYYFEIVYPVLSVFGFQSSSEIECTIVSFINTIYVKNSSEKYAYRTYSAHEGTVFYSLENNLGMDIH